RRAFGIRPTSPHTSTLCQRAAFRRMLQASDGQDAAPLRERIAIAPSVLQAQRVEDWYFGGHRGESHARPRSAEEPRLGPQYRSRGSGHQTIHFQALARRRPESVVFPVRLSTEPRRNKSETLPWSPMPPKT